LGTNYSFSILKYVTQVTTAPTKFGIAPRVA
jgi:hypothetical protein